MAAGATKQAADGRTANQDLAPDVRATRQGLVEASRDKAAAAQALQASQAAVLDRDGKLKAAEAQTSALTTSLASARHDAVVASEAMKRAGDDRTTNQALVADLRATPQRLQDLEREKTPAAQALRALQAAELDREGKLKSAEAQISSLTASLAAARHDAMVALETAKRAGDDRTASQTLEADLRATRQRLEDAGREKTAAAQALRALQAAASDRESKLKEAEAQTAALTASLASARHDATVASETTKRASDERIANQALEADLRTTRQRLEDTGREKTAAAQALHALQATVLDRDSKLKAAEAQTSALSASLASARHDATTASETTKQARSEGVSVGRRPAGSLASATLEPNHLIEDLPSNIVLRYRAGDPVAQQKAKLVKSSLTEYGLASSEAAEAVDITPGVHVTYYYKQDQNLARQVSKSVASAEPSQKRAGRNQMPLPGTVEISVGG